MDGVFSVLANVDWSAFSSADTIVSFVGSVIGGAIGVRAFGAKLLPCGGACRSRVDTFARSSQSADNQTAPAWLPVPD